MYAVSLFMPQLMPEAHDSYSESSYSSAGSLVIESAYTEEIVDADGQRETILI